jgi:hypothetical protein
VQRASHRRQFSTDPGRSDARGLTGQIDPKTPFLPAPAIQETAIDEMPRLQHLSGDVVGWEEKLDQHREESAKLDTLSLGRRNR